MLLSTTRPSHFRVLSPMLIVPKRLHSVLSMKGGPHREAPVNHAIMDEHVHDAKKGNAKPSPKAYAAHEGGCQEPAGRQHSL